ncbi:hypothetical protein SAMN05421823_102640 [Catalinimonas alkaloidigena]|uniref:Cell division protein ZapB n=1 Tax=Catalinimonas alkaloidigena TaxID=1075417 RepID=A0A1G9BK59_9BACT|nr:hypothetical protein [Catalinimonas alkaloidigena]SDK39846.1 hypothetical protein SAMN05421823_102640 [Catalinimonas alkaloidigena]
MAETNPEARKSRRGLIIGIIALLLILNGVQFYLSYQNREERAQVEQEKDTEIRMATQELDSLRSELEERYNEIAQLGGDTASLRAAMRDLDVQLQTAQRSARVNASELRDIQADYKLLLSQKDNEIAELKAQNEILFQENTSLKQTIVSRNDSLKNLTRQTQQMAEKVAVASVLKAENLHVSYIDDRGRERDDNDNTFRGRRVDKIKVNFSIGDNPVAKIENKEVMIRILEPEGSTLQDVATGSGTFEYEGQEIFYTAKQNFLFDNKNPRLTFIYSKGTPFKEGRHTVELYAEGAKIGESQFTIK